MDLNDEQIKSVKKHLTDKVPMGISCNVCQHRDWEITPKIFEISGFQPDHVRFGGPRIPLISVRCSNCSNTLLFNAIGLDLGLVPQSKKKEATNE